MSKKVLLTISVAILTLLVAFFLLTQSKSETIKITTQVSRGPFEMIVYSSGQLEAQNSENIVVPNNLRDRDVRIYEITITDLVEEGTVVDSGDYVGTLDQKAVEEALTTAREELEQNYNEFEDAKLDSNLTLSNFRDQIINAKDDVEEKKIILDESVYESPSVIRKAEMDLDKAKRKLEQEIQGYELKKRQAVSKVERKKIEVRQLENRVNKLSNVYESLIITAPKSGMVIYSKDRSREKIKVGSTVSPWMPNIATLPDLSSMLSITFVNEIDISKIKVGQKVVLGIDALPEEVLEGEVVTVANIGQPMPKSDAKVFEVKIRVFGDVRGLKPAMTTSNQIQTGYFSDTLFVPSEAVFSNDSMQFVYIDEGGAVKQVVDLGDQNENHFLVRKGLKEGDVVLLTKPENADDLPIEGMDIYREILERRTKEEEEARKAQEEDKAKPFKLQKKGSGNSSNVIVIG
ncbi:efflux RND transporter periplasmic adaptor subunit [Mariniphaga sediminis]|uniref:efflux RND transporter periplasmic adaptor subunit n=1 Tax=Mariniphaga sediminis TaxID=1628158 RepID=UPI003565EF69